MPICPHLRLLILRQIRRFVANCKSTSSFAAVRFNVNVHSVTWACLFMVFFCISESNAQFSYQRGGEERDSTDGYWRVITHAGTRSTQVQFYGREDQLLYQENLPEKWVKPGKRSRRQLDKMLQQILANQLVVARLKTQILPPTPPRKYAASKSRDIPTGEVSYKVHSYVSSKGKLYVVIDNPEQLRYKIEITNEKGQSVYEEFTNIDQYRRRLDISPILVGTLQVIIAIDNKRFVYDVRKHEPENLYSIEPLIAVN